MKAFCVAAFALSSALLVHGQSPVQVVSATKVADDTVRVVFSVPVTPAGLNAVLSDDFSGAAVDTTKWRVNDTPFEPGGGPTAESSVELVDGEAVIDIETETAPWGGISLATVDSYSASADSPLVFEIDRVAHEEDGSATRTGIWITDATRSRYVFFSENEGGGGWQYNRLIGVEGDNPQGQGAIAALVNGEEFNDLGSHRIKAVLNGTTVRLYLDDLFATEIPFPLASGIVFEFGAYAADAGDLVTGHFDNARVATMNAPTLSNFTIDNGASVSAVATTSDSRLLELTTSTLAEGTSYTLTVNGVQSDDGITSENATTPITSPADSLYATTVLADEPLVYYPMDSINGSEVPNLGSSETAGTFVSSTDSILTRGPGLPEFPGFHAGNTAALFDGIGTYTDDEDLVQLPGIGNFIDVGAPLLLDLPAFTIEAWIRPANLDEIRLGIAGTWGTEFGFSNPGEIHIFTGGGGIIYSPYPFSYHEWHHVVVAGDGTNLTIYADGEVLARIEEETDNYGGEDRTVYVGGGGIFDDIELDGFGNWFPGGIDELAIYDKALTEERVKAHFEAAFARELRPTISITSPTENATVAPGASVPVTVQVSAAEGRTISRVEYFDRFVKVGESTTAPFSFTIPSISEGRHSLRAEAYDDLGVSTESAAVRFIVGTPKPLIVMVVASAENPTEAEEEVRLRLASQNYDVQYVQSNQLTEADVADAALVVVPVVRADSVGETLRELAVPILTWDQELEPTFLFTEDEVDVFWGDTGPELYISIVDATHSLAAGLPAEVLLVNEFPQEFAWGVPGPEATIIATLESDPERAVIYAYDKGVDLIDGTAAPERRVFFMLTDDTFLALNEDGLRLFDAAVAWTVRTVEASPVLNLPTIQGGNINLSWTGTGTLQSSTNLVNGPWEDIQTTGNQHSLSLDQAPYRFFRVAR